MFKDNTKVKHYSDRQKQECTIDIKVIQTVHYQCNDQHLKPKCTR